VPFLLIAASCVSIELVFGAPTAEPNMAFRHPHWGCWINKRRSRFGKGRQTTTGRTMARSVRLCCLLYGERNHIHRCLQLFVYCRDDVSLLQPQFLISTVRVAILSRSTSHLFSVRFLSYQGKRLTRARHAAHKSLHSNRFVSPFADTYIF